MITTLLVIDPQNDFCDPKGALYVPGAAEDCGRLVTLIQRIGEHLATIHVTMDTHHYFHIAHPAFWIDKNGNHPDPFTMITSEMVKSALWQPVLLQYRQYVSDYVATLDKTGKYSLCVWPPHCLIGSWGHNIQPELSQTLVEWEKSIPGRVVDYTYKGSNVRTEHYSAIRAEVSDAADPGSRTNFALIERLKSADTILISGEALSHCVANTVRDLLTCIPATKLVVLTDTCSNVPGFEKLGSQFLAEIESIGVRLMESINFNV